MLKTNKRAVLDVILRCRLREMSDTEKSINLIVFSAQVWYNLGIEKRGYQYAKN